MGDFTTDGLLSNDINEYIKKYNTDYKDWFHLCNVVNREAQEAMLSIKANQFDMEAVLVTTLFLRVLETFQAIVILAERGILNQCRMLIRCMLDATFPLVAISKDEEHKIFKDYILQTLFERKRFAGKYGKLEEAKEYELKSLEELTKELERQIEKEEVKEKNRYYWAEIAKLTNWYNTEYALTSMTVHASAHDLENSYLHIEDGLITELKWGPTDEGMARQLMSAIQLIIVAYSAQNEYFCTKKTSWVTDTQKKLDELTRSAQL